MIDFDDYKSVMDARTTAQEIEYDQREKKNECISFVTDPDGQWEDGISARFDEYGRPRYTFDLTGTIVNKYYGEMTQNDFNIRVTPMGGGATKKAAQLRAGLVKNTEALSRATNVYSMSARMQMICGFDCMRVDQDWASPDSFDQDLFIRHITDSVNRVWFLGNYQERTCEDADGVIVEHLVSMDEYEDRFKEKEKSPCSLGDSDPQPYHYYKRNGIRIAELIYKKRTRETIYQTKDGMTLNEEDFKKSGLKIKDVKSKVRDAYKICVRWFDGKQFLSDPEDTVFDYLPVVPVLPNFMIVGDKPMSKGVVEPLMDWQRIRNYTGSAFVEETALAPKDAIFMTRKQIQGNESAIGKINVAGRPVVPYTPDDTPGAVPPYKPGAYQHNQGLASMFTMSEQGIQASAGMFAAGLGDNPGLQSGVAIEKLDNNSNLGAVEYFKAQEVALGHLGKILITAYPKLYDTEQERRIVKDDGSDDLVKINEVGLNGEVINDMSVGIYDCYCDIGKAFRNKQEQAAQKFVELGTIDPNIVLENEDILLNSIDSPGMDLAAERARSRLMKQGAIPESQWTDDEKEAAAAAAQAAAQNPAPPDPNVMIGQAALEEAQAKTVKNEIEAIKLQQAQQKMDFEQQKQKIELEMVDRKDQVQFQTDTMNMLKTMSEILKNLGESSEKDVSLSPDAQAAYDEQARDIQAVQQSI